MKKLSMEERFWAKVEKTETCWNWTAAKVRGGYGHFNKDGRAQCAHRVSYEMHFGPIDKSLDVDHICHNQGCVNPAHLRAATRKQNMENQRGAHARSKTGIRGVYWHKGHKRYVATVYHNKKVAYLAEFLTLEEAAESVKAKRLELYTHNDVDRAEKKAA